MKEFRAMVMISRTIWMLVRVDRIGSFANDAGQLVDGYQIFVEKKGLFSKKKTEVAKIYINSYCQDMPTVAPKGFVLA